MQRSSGHQTGSWEPDNSLYGSKGGRIYCTTLAALTLEVYYRYLRLYDEPKIPLEAKDDAGRIKAKDDERGAASRTGRRRLRIVGHSSGPVDSPCRFASQDFFSARAFSIAVSIFLDNGLLGLNRAMTSPFRSTRNLVKFHGISPANLGLVSLLVR